jgi:hypothetical protein
MFKGLGVGFLSFEFRTQMKGSRLRVQNVDSGMRVHNTGVLLVY